MSTDPTRAVSWLPRSFRGQLAGGVALLVGLLAVSLSLTLGTLLSRQSRADEGTALHTVARNAAHALAEGLAVREREVRVMAASPTLWSDGLGAERVRQVLQRSQAINPHSAWIGVADARGVVQAATGGLLVGATVKQRPWFQAGMQAVHVGDVHPAKLLAGLLPPGSDGGPQRFVDFAAPIMANGRLLGVVGIHGSWDWSRATIQALLPDTADQRSLEVFVFDRSGEPIYAAGRRLDGLRSSGQKLPLAPLRAGSAAGARPLATAITWQDGQDYLTSAVSLPGPLGANHLGWTIVAREPVDVAFAAGRRGARLALALGLGAALLACVLGGWMATRLTRPLRRIADAAQAVEQGATQLPLQHGSVEIEGLSRALGAMTDRLVQARAELEQRVADRTAELERVNRELAQLARHDPLTGLLNRRGLDERLNEVLSGARRRGSPVCVMVVDADHFKRINDRYGHDVGDQVLQGLSGALRQRLREVDVLARVGGEEFVAVLPDTDAEAAGRLADALLQLVAGREMPGVGRVTVSIGVAQVAAGSKSAQAALQLADQALYRAKQGGRNRREVALAEADGRPALEVA